MLPIHLLPAERDFAVRISGTTSIGRAIDSFLDCMPIQGKETGAAVLLRSPSGHPGHCRGHLGMRCLSLLIGEWKPQEPHGSIQILELGRKGDVEGHVCLIGEQFLDTGILCTIERMAQILVSHLIHLETRERQTRAMEHAELQVRELRHRLRNSMQLCMNLLQELAAVDGPANELSIQEILSRIHALFTIQELYIWEDSSGILEAGNFFESLIRTLRPMLEEDLYISLDMDGDLNWYLNLNRATCMALTIYELAVNSIKHSQKRPLQLRIEVRRDKRSLILRYSDDSASPINYAFSEKTRDMDPDSFAGEQDISQAYAPRPKGAGSRIIAALCLRMGAQSRIVSHCPWGIELVLAPASD